jgi:exodeoxyribonuclease VII small subunit
MIDPRLATPSQLTIGGRRVQACRRPPTPDPFNCVFPVTQPKADPSAAPVTPDFEASLAELETIVERLEQGDLSLDDSLKQFERGVQLTRACQTALTQAEQKVEILLRKSGASGTDADGYEAAPFESDDSDD